MKKCLFTFCLFAIFTTLFSKDIKIASNCNRFIKADDPSITYTGRTEILPDGSVRYDWVGVYLQTSFSGSSIAVSISESGRSFHNIFIDGKWIRKIEITGKQGHTIFLASGLSKGYHVLKLQKCTEGEFGCTTVHGFYIPQKGLLRTIKRKTRLIEIYGDSYTCGYGSEAHSPQEHFTLDTENCNLSYGCIIARYFDADYALIAHSGRGLVRNYGDNHQESKNTMSTRSGHTYDDFDTVNYNFKTYHPDLVIINLGSNDYSPIVTPSVQQYANAYINLINSIKRHYKKVIILCIIPHSTNDYLKCGLNEVRKKTQSIKGVFMSNPMPEILPTDDLGADIHPNYIGHQKIAMNLIPTISTIMNWKLENKTIK
jgi:lysophospholipase L1-like esterase